MKRTLLLIFPVLLLSSCKKDNNGHIAETIIKGSKWNLKIGSSYPDVYAQLQQLGIDKGFSTVAIVGQQPISKLQDLQHRLEFYHAITLEKNTERIESVRIQFKTDKVNSIEAGGALPDEILRWPQDIPDQMAIHKDDPISEIYNKLVAINQLPAYSNNYKFILPDKPLNKPFDPVMINYDEWFIYFSINVEAGLVGASNIGLYFKDGKLNKILYTYNEGEVFN